MKKILLVLGCAMLLAVTASLAQEFQGNLFLTVNTPDGAAAGAVIDVAGRDFTRTATTDDEGKVRFIRLVPGSYDITVTLAGYAKVVHQGVVVDAFANVSIEIPLEKLALEETVVVKATTPLLDVRKTGTATVLSQTEISEIPTARDPWAILSTIPGVTTDRVNVGGNESGQQSNFVGKGDDGSNTGWWMDGIDFSDVGASGATSTYLDFNSFDQIGVVTSGADIEQQTAGLNLRFVTKQGTNRHSGNARLWFTEEGLQSSNAGGLKQPSNIDADDDGFPDAFAGNQINEVFEKNFDLGGPLWRDHIWYWFGFSQNDVDVRVITGASDKTKLRNTSLKLHGQIKGETTWKAFYTNGEKTKDGRGAADTRPPETTWDQSGPSPIWTGYVSHFFSPNFEMSAQYSEVKGAFSLTPKGSLDNQIFLDEDGVWHNTFFLYETERPREQYTVKGNNFFETGDWEHEVKYGFRYQTASVESISKASNAGLYSSKVNVPEGGVPYVYLYRDVDIETDHDYMNVWAADTVLHGPWTLTGGVHWSQASGKNKPRTIAANSLCPTCLPELDFGGNDAGGFEWEDFSPRVGATYTFDRDRRILLRGNYARYVDGLGAADLVYANPAQFYTYLLYEWDDANDDDFVDPGEFATTGDCTIDPIGANNIDPCNPTDFFNKIDPNWEAPRTDEFLIGAEYEIARDFTVGATVTLRQKDRMRWYEGRLENVAGPLYDVNVFDMTGDLVPISSSAYDCGDTVSGAFPNGSPYDETRCFLDDTSATTAARPRFYTDRPGYEQEYTGLELTATKRLSHRWMLRGYVSLDSWEQDFSGSSGIQDPTNYQGGTIEDGGDVAVPSVGSGTKDGIWLGTSTWAVNVNGLVQLPHDVTLSGNLYGREGFGIPYYAQTTIVDSDDRVTPTRVQVNSIDSKRYDDLWNFDFKVAKLLHLEGGTAVELSGEVFNVFNENTTLGLDPRASDSGRTNKILEILSPRIIRFGATVTF